MQKKCRTFGIVQGVSRGQLIAFRYCQVTSKDDVLPLGLSTLTYLDGLLGLGILVTVFAVAGSATPEAQQLLAERIATSLTAGEVMLALVIVIMLIIQSRNTFLLQTRIKGIFGKECRGNRRYLVHCGKL